MKRVLFLVLAASLGGAATPASAKPKKATTAEVRKKGEKPPRSDDKGTNEGARGRMNATEDAARQSDAPQFEHRP